MVLRTVLVLAGLLVATSVLAEAYKWVDEDGVTHYSDRPREGAELVELSEYTRTTGAQIFRDTRRAASATSPAEEAAPFKYESLSVASPGPEETLWNIEGVLNVSLALSFQIEEVWRGVHNIQAEVIDETGKLMIRSRTNRFYVQQSTVNTGAP